MKQRPMTLRIIVLLLSFGLVGGYVAYRVWAQPDGPSTVNPVAGDAEPKGQAVHLGGSKSMEILPSDDAKRAIQNEAQHFVGSKSAAVFTPPPKADEPQQASPTQGK